MELLLVLMGFGPSRSGAQEIFPSLPTSCPKLPLFVVVCLEDAHCQLSGHLLRNCCWPSRVGPTTPFSLQLHTHTPRLT